MKKLLLCLLCLTLLPLAALAEGYDDILPRIYEKVEWATGLTADAFDAYNVVGDAEVGWSFSLRLKEHPEDEDGLWHGELTPDGELLHLREPQKISPYLQAMYQVLGCLRTEDCYLRLPEVVEHWKNRWDELFDTELLQQQMIDGQSLGITDILTLDIRTPDEKAIPYLGALSAAQHYVLAKPGWDEKALMRFEVSYAAYTVPRDIGKPVWQFFFDEILDLDDLYWTINGEPAPVYFSILVDAETGAILDSCFDYAPARFTIPQHIIRPKMFYDPAPFIDGGWG